MKKFQFSLRMIVLLGLLLAACNQVATPTLPGAAVSQASCPLIQVGVVIAGSDTEGGAEQLQGYEMALAEINAAGGIKTCPLSLYYPPDKETLNPESAQIAMLDLIQQNVVAVAGATSTNATKRAAALANYFKIPFLISSDTGDDVMETGTTWLFRVPPPNSQYAGAAFDLVKATTQTQVDVAILFEQSEFGWSAATTAGQSVLDHGLSLVLYKGYDPNTADSAPIVADLNNAQPDVVYLISSGTPLAWTLLNASQEPSLPAHTTIANGSGFTSSEFLYDDSGNLNSGLENVFLTVPWKRELPRSLKFVEDLKSHQLKNNVDQIPPVSRIVEAYSALKLVASALNQLPDYDANWKAKLNSADGTAKFREELAKVLRTPPTGSWDTLMGPILFDDKGQNQQDVMLVQVRGGKITTVFP